MVHRVALSMVGLLCQLQATVPIRDLEMRWSPGFRETVADHLGVDDSDLLATSLEALTKRYGAFALTPASAAL